MSFTWLWGMGLIEQMDRGRLSARPWVCVTVWLSLNIEGGGGIWDWGAGGGRVRDHATVSVGLEPSQSSDSTLICVLVLRFGNGLREWDDLRFVCILLLG